MRLISEEYAALNQNLHTQRPTYGASGKRWTIKVLEMGYTDVLDYGCGKSTLAKSLPFPIKEYDPAVPGKMDPPEPADFVVCTDVLEHIEPEYLDSVLDDLKRLTLKKALLVVATRPANKTLEDGRNAHLIIQPLAWWLGKIGDRFDIEDVKEDASQPGEFMLIVRKRD